ncbi:hypothetical protein [Fibrella forsythiae]|uniref:Right handed beta helix domain-containing protein n=1 Tax=Fibrella forsythiae TaxID=2817061 RepID=A0ABS3JD96_9BACT|nr:hypothetical protein [Fibrella forsythiae]MBO0947234.1 hypothetical protein [Fibrella forsythiae]
MKQLTFLLLALLALTAPAQTIKVDKIVEVNGTPKYRLVTGSTLKDFPISVGPKGDKGDTGPQGPAGPAGSGGSSNPFFDVIFPTTAAELNAAIANCTKPVLYVGGSSLSINQTLVVNNKAKLQIIAFDMDVTLTSWNNGEQGIMLDLRGTLSNVTIHGFRFNCLLPASSGDGGGYGLVAARGGVCPSIDGLTIQDCYFTTPNIHQNAIALVCVGWGGYGTRTNVTVRNCVGENVKRFFFEVHNQEVFDTDATPRYSNIVVIDCRARNLGAAGVKSPGVATDGGMFFSADGAGRNNKVIRCQVTNPYFAAFEAVGTSDVEFTDCKADYETGYTANFAGYSFTDGNHGAAFGPKRVKVSGGYVRCTGRGYNLTEGGSHSFYDVTFKSNQGNTLVRTSGNEFRKCEFIGVATKEALHYFNNANSNVFTDGYMGNEGIPNDQTGGRCTIVLDNGSSNNRLFYLRHFQEKRTNGDGDFYEATYLNFSGGSTNQVLYNQSNNPSPGF